MSRKRKQSFCSATSSTNEEDANDNGDGLAIGNADKEWLPVTKNKQPLLSNSIMHDTNDSISSQIYISKPSSINIINKNWPRFWRANVKATSSQMPVLCSTVQQKSSINLANIVQSSAYASISGKPQAKRFKLCSPLDAEHSTTASVGRLLSTGQTSLNFNSNLRMPQHSLLSAPIRPTILRQYNLLSANNHRPIRPLSLMPSDRRNGPISLVRTSTSTSAAPGLRFAASDLTNEEKNAMLSLKYSQVPCRAGDLLVGEKCLQLVEESSNNLVRTQPRLRPSAKFLCDLGFALVKDSYQTDFVRSAERDRKLRSGASVSVNPQKQKSSSKSKASLQLASIAVLGDEEDDDYDYDDDVKTCNSDSDWDLEEYDSVQQEPASESYWQSILSRDSSISTTHLRQGLKYRCTSCQFASCCEVSVLLHYEQGHQDFSGVYRCALCQNASRDAATFQAHMATVHAIQAKPLGTLRLPHTQCTLCDYEVPIDLAASEIGPFLHNHMRRCFSRGTRDYSNLLRPCLDDFNLVFFNEAMNRAFLFGFFVRLLSKSSSSQVTNSRPAASSSKIISVKVAADASAAGKIQVCELCNGLASDNQRLMSHLRTQHSAQLDSNVDLPSLTCRACGKNFWTSKGLAQHNDHRGKGRCSLGRVCPVCGRPFLYGQLYHHLADAHMTALETQLMAGQCLICPDREGSVAFVSLTLHLEQVHGLRLGSYVDKHSRKERYFFCDLKGESLDLASNAAEVLVDEKQGPVPRRLYECSQCSFSFFTSNQLRNHVLRSRHFFTCFRCRSDKTAKIKREFKTHEELAGHLCITHANERDPCQLCDERPLRGESFSAHVRIRHLRDCKIRVLRMRDVACIVTGQPTSVLKSNVTLVSNSLDVQIGTLDAPILLD